MSRITIRNLELRLMRELRRRAAERGCSPEDEARDILRLALGRRPSGARSQGAAGRASNAPAGGREFDMSPRGPMTEPPLPPL